MKKKEDILEELAGHRPFTVPQDYFQGLDSRIMQALPTETPKAEPVRVTAWMRLKPYVYMAAAFAGLFFGIGFFAGSNNGGVQEDDSAALSEFTIYSDDYIDSFLDESMVSDCMIYDLLVEN